MSRARRPTLFCYVVAADRGYETPLLHLQRRLSAGVFGCDGFAVLTNYTGSRTNGNATAAPAASGSACSVAYIIQCIVQLYNL